MTSKHVEKFYTCLKIFTHILLLINFTITMLNFLWQKNYIISNRCISTYHFTVQLLGIGTILQFLTLCTFVSILCKPMCGKNSKVLKRLVRTVIAGSLVSVRFFFGYPSFELYPILGSCHFWVIFVLDIVNQIALLSDYYEHKTKETVNNKSPGVDAENQKEETTTNHGSSAQDTKTDTSELERRQ